MTEEREEAVEADSDDAKAKAKANELARWLFLITMAASAAYIGVVVLWIFM